MHPGGVAGEFCGDPGAAGPEGEGDGEAHEEGGDGEEEDHGAP